MDGIGARLAGHSLIGLDTSIFIYHFEAHPKYSQLTQKVLKDVAAGAHEAVTSTITLMELTVLPWRENRPNVAQSYEALLANFPNLKIADVTRNVARRAAQLRAQYNLRPSDALQIGTALVGGATVWISNDQKHNRVSDQIEIILLDEFRRNP